LSEILKTTHRLEEKEINDIENYSEHTYMESMREYKESLEEDNKNLQEEVANNKLKIESLTGEVEEFRSFKKGRIWKTLEKYRKIRTKIKGK